MTPRPDPNPDAIDWDALDLHRREPTWLAGLQPGAPVIVVKTFVAGPATLRRGEVVTMTPHRVTVAIPNQGAHLTFRRSDGREAGGNQYHPARIVEPTPERRAARALQARRRMALDAWSRVDLNALPVAFLEAALAVLGLPGARDAREED